MAWLAFSIASKSGYSLNDFGKTPLMQLSIKNEFLDICLSNLSESLRVIYIRTVFSFHVYIVELFISAQYLERINL